MLIHNVYFWLKPDLAADARARFQEQVALLCGLPGVERGHCGVPAPTPERPVTDHSFDYALTLEFADQAAHDGYQDSPEHHRFVARCSDLWERVVVYDTLAS